VTAGDGARRPGRWGSVIGLGVLLLTGCGGGSGAAPEVPPEARVHEQLPTDDSPSTLPADESYDPFHSPIPGNVFVTPRSKYLYIAWSIPKDRAPLAALDRPEQREPFVLNSGLELCQAHLDKVADRPEVTHCMLHLLLLHSNDEYSKSASGSWTSIGKASLPLTALEPGAAALRSGTVGEVRALWEAVRLDFSKLPMPTPGG